MSLKVKFFNSLRWTTLSTISVSVMQIAQIAILTRFLNPTDFGLMALILVVIGFSQSFLDMGISNAIIYNQNVSHTQLSTLYWLNIASGVVIYCIIILISPLISNFYNEPKLTSMLVLTGATFLIQPFGQQYMVLFKKELYFNQIAKIDMGGKLVSLIVSVIFAYKSFGVYSLVFGLISGTIFQTILYVVKGLKIHKPSFICNLSGIKEYLNFGIYQMGEKTVNYFNSQMDTVLIGKLLGSEALGLYNIAKQITMRPAQIFNPIITKVTFPTMAKVQNEIEKLKNIYLKTINYLSSINFVVYVLIIVFAEEIVLILFGFEWRDTIPLIKILSLYGALRSTVNPVGSLLLAKGKAKLGFYWNLGLFIFMPLGIYISSAYGLLGVSWGLVLLLSLSIFPNWLYLVKPLCGAGFREYFLQILRPLLIAVIIYLLCSSLNILNINKYLKIILTSVLSIVLFISLNWFFNRDFIQTVSSLIRAKNK